VDYLAEILRNLRNHDTSQLYREHFELSADISTRDRTAIEKTFSGLIKILFPHQEADPREIEELLRFAIEGRKRIKDQLMRIDSTYAPVRFSYRDAGGGQFHVKALEEEMYPQYYGSSARAEDAEEGALPLLDAVAATDDDTPGGLPEKHLVFQENQRGVSFEALFGPYLKDARKIVVTDPYIRLFFQIRNLMELLETIARQKADDDEVDVHLITAQDEFKGEQQDEYLTQMQTVSEAIGIHFTWEYDKSGAIHARHIVTDHGWKILLDRGLDIFQRYEMNDAFNFANRLQRYRACKGFEVTFLRI
jgi:ATP-dependent Lon protease